MVHTVHPVAGEDPGGVLDVVLGVVALSDGVQLEELAAEVLVGGLLRRAGVVQRDAHGGVGDGVDEHLVEPSERVGADDLAVVGAVQEHPVVVEGDVEVVLPELGHHLQHLTVGVDAPQQAPAGVVRHLRPAALDLGLVPLPDAGRVEVDRDPPRLERVGLGVGDRCGVQLGLEPRLGAAGVPHLGVQGGRDAVAEPAGQVQRGSGRQRRGREARLDGRFNRGVDGGLDRRVHGRLDRRVDGRVHGRLDRRVHGRLARAAGSECSSAAPGDCGACTGAGDGRCGSCAAGTGGSACTCGGGPG